MVAVLYYKFYSQVDLESWGSLYFGFPALAAIAANKFTLMEKIADDSNRINGMKSPFG